MRTTGGVGVRRACLLLVLTAVHVLLLVIAARPQLRVARDTEAAPLQWVMLSPAAQSPPVIPQSKRAAAPRRPATAPVEESHAITLAAPPPAEATGPGSIDWSAQAQLVARQSVARDAGPHERSLDDHSKHGSHQDGLGLNSRSKPEFGWYYAGTHRFDTSSGLPVINLSDNCVIPIGALIPLPLCKIGKIPARGDLFKHMHDPPPEEAQDH